MTTSNSRLGQALASGRLALTAECFPPRGSDAGAVKHLSSLLPPSLDAVVVADNPGGIRGSALACAAMLAGQGRPSVLSMVTRDRNRIALESDARGAAALGVEAILCLSGDHQSLGACPQAAGVYDIDSIQFTQALKRMMREGALPEAPIGAAAHPYQQPVELGLLRLRKKIAAGAGFLLTQAVFDLAGFAQWMDAVRAAGLDKQVAIFASVLPLTSVEQAQDLDRRRTYGPVAASIIARLSAASDPAQEGMAIAVEMAGQLKTIPGVRGIHILSGGCEGLAATVIERAGLA
jgi:methylenetetrahydrofolate reductase (NADPH)